MSVEKIPKIGNQKIGLAIMIRSQPDPELLVNIIYLTTFLLLYLPFGRPVV